MRVEWVGRSSRYFAHLYYTPMTKRKVEGERCAEGGVIEVEKKQKVDDETKRLSVLFATHLGSAEVARQPHRVQ